MARSRMRALTSISGCAGRTAVSTFQHLRMRFLSLDLPADVSLGSGIRLDSTLPSPAGVHSGSLRPAEDRNPRSRKGAPDFKGFYDKTRVEREYFKNRSTKCIASTFPRKGKSTWNFPSNAEAIDEHPGLRVGGLADCALARRFIQHFKGRAADNSGIRQDALQLGGRVMSSVFSYLASTSAGILFADVEHILHVDGIRVVDVVGPTGSTLGTFVGHPSRFTPLPAPRVE